MTQRQRSFLICKRQSTTVANVLAPDRTVLPGRVPASEVGANPAARGNAPEFRLAALSSYVCGNYRGTCRSVSEYDAGGGAVESCGAGGAVELR